MMVIITSGKTLRNIRKQVLLTAGQDEDPVRLTASGEIDRRSSGCISGEKMDRLKDYVYDELREMAESLYSGDAEAVPLIIGGEKPCDFCDYVNICDNSRMERYRLPDAEKLAEAEDILGSDTKGRRNS